MPQNLNIDFFNEYKRLDKLCSDIYSKNSGGVTSYINDMEHISSLGRVNIPEWDATYSKLKSVRYVRNQMAHGEGSFEDYECNYEDVKWLRDFYEKIMNVSDPIAIYRKNIKLKKQVQNKNVDYKNYDKPTRSIEANKLYAGSDKSRSRVSLLGVIIFSFIGMILVMIMFYIFLEYFFN